MYKHKGFTIVELMVVIVVIAILASLTLVAYTSIKDRANDSRRIQDIAMMKKAIEIYLAQNGKLPPRSPSASSWAISSNQPDDYISGITGASAGMAEMPELPVDPINNSSYYYRYYVYGAGTSGCDPNRGRFYVLQVRAMEAGSHPHADSPGWKCPTRDWSSEADYTVGGFEH